MTTIIAFIVIFCILVVVHEFGHFYFAKPQRVGRIVLVRRPQLRAHTDRKFPD